MEYKKSELRNNSRPLLSRIQRQIDVRKNTIIPIQTEKKPHKKDFNSFAIQELDTTDKLILKDTRLKLYKKRGGR